jgi:sec-independent protein translocase protein TatA
MGISAANLLVILLIVFIVFGAGKLPKVMGDLGKGLKSFKDAMNGHDEKEETSTKEKPIELVTNNKDSNEQNQQ